MADDDQLVVKVGLRNAVKLVPNPAVVVGRLLLDGKLGMDAGVSQPDIAEV